MSEATARRYAETCYRVTCRDAVPSWSVVVSARDYIHASTKAWEAMQSAPRPVTVMWLHPSASHLYPAKGTPVLKPRPSREVPR